MAPRISLPGELFLDAAVIYPLRLLDTLGTQRADGDFGTPQGLDDASVQRARERRPYVALRWVLNPILGIPLQPFTVWRREIAAREAPQPIPGWHQAGPNTFEWDGVTEMLRIELDLVGPATVTGLHRADLAAVQTVTGNNGDTIVLDAGPMLSVQVSNPGAIGAQRAQSLTSLANGDGWQPIELVGLPFDPDQLAATYYSGDQQGPIGALTDPIDAAVGRLKQWGPVLGWVPLGGLDPWVPPDPEPLVDEMLDNLLPGLAEIMANNPPPLLDKQINAEPAQPYLGRMLVRNVAAADEAQITVRPLQALMTSVATDTWASLALGFGTGDQLRGDATADYMVTAPWHGRLRTAVQPPWPWPFNAPPPQYIDIEVERELAAVYLSPQARSIPPVPTPLTTGIGHDEGADDVDQPYRVSATLQTPRAPTVPRQPTTAGYALARFDGPGDGSYLMREHPKAHGWIPGGAAAPVLAPGTPPDPRTPANTVTLRNSGAPRPITGAPNTFQYYTAATDLFGQWSRWSTAWLSLPPADVQTPVVASVHARATVGAAGGDPCTLKVTTDVVWHIRERSLHTLSLAIDVYTPFPDPPKPYGPPPDTPQGGTVTVATITLGFAADGTPDPAPAGVTVAPVHDDDTPVTAADPAEGDDRRYRITVDALPVSFSGRPEVAVAVYAAAQETIRPEWSVWSHTREPAIAANPIPPPPPTPLPAVYPAWASLPDAAGLSYASVTWIPFGAWRYRVYEATEAALLAACGQPGPVLTDGFGARMQALFDLYQDHDNLPKLKRAFRKLGQDPVFPPVVDGKMRLDVLLPRGSALIHCYVVVGVTESNVISSWPQPDGDGRKGFDGYAIPRPRQCALPQIRAALTGPAAAEVTVTLDGSVPATRIALYRTVNAVLARSIGTMTEVATVPAGTAAPEFWKKTVITDPAAPVGWSRLQYRAIALTDDDPDHAGMAVPSAPSRAYALLNPPPDPTVALTPNVAGTTSQVSIVRLDTNALRGGSDIGDFTIAATVTAADQAAPVRSPVLALGDITDFATTAALAASTANAGYVGTTLYLRLARNPGQELDLAVDVADPLGRTSHAIVHIPAQVPDPTPHLIITGAHRTGGVAFLTALTNVTLPPDPAQDWTLQVRARQMTFPPKPDQIQTFRISAIPTIPSLAAMPNPSVDPAPFEIRRVTATAAIRMWMRSATPLRVGLTLTNSSGQSFTAGVAI
ncbi:hypothetical protein A5729_15805 [Mycobacterium vulneris]|nr:hypothetical protein A5729_15805 [Mycolicibacterium vulneris]